MDLFILIVVLVGFLVYAALVSRGVNTLGTFFHGGVARQHAISLGAFNVTLGAGLVYQMTLGVQFGIWAFLQVLAIPFGYLLLALFVSRCVPEGWMQARNVFAVADESIAAVTGRRSAFGLLFSLALSVFYILILALESYVAGGLLAAVTIPDGGTGAAVVLSFVLLFASLVYTLLGGMKAVLGTDLVQLVFIAALVVAISIVAFQVGAGGEVARGGFTMSEVFILVTLVFLAIATQFYSPVNWATVSDLSRKEQFGTFLSGGIIGAVVLGLITFAGIRIGWQNGERPFDVVLGSFEMAGGGFGVYSVFLRVILICGMVSMVISTIDSVMIRIVMLLYDNVFSGDSKQASSSATALKSIRVGVVGAFGAFFVPLSLLNWFQPSVMFTLIGLVAGLNVLAPLACTLPYLAISDIRRLAVLTPAVVASFSAFVVLCAGAGFTFSLLGQSMVVTAVSVGGLILSCLGCLGLILFSRRYSTGSFVP